MSTHCPVSKFPFKTSLSLDLLIDYWKEQTRSSNKIKAKWAKDIISKLDGISELHGSIDDPAILEKHKDIVDILMSEIYQNTENTLIKGSIKPFSFTKFYSTKRYSKIIPEENNIDFSHIDIDLEKMLMGKILNAYSIILKELYNYEIKLDNPVIMSFTDPQSKLVTHYQFNADLRFNTVKPVGKLPKVSIEQIQKQIRNATDIKGWIELLPPEKFHFVGFTTITATDITVQETISRLKRDLLEREALTTIEGFNILQDRMRSLLKLPDIKLGLSVFPEKDLKSYNTAHHIGSSFVLNDTCIDKCTHLDESFYAEATKQKKVLIIDNLEEHKNLNKVEKSILDQGIKNILIAPLFYENKFIGLFEIASEKPCRINTLNTFVLKEVLPLLSTAVKRSMDEQENKIQAVIKEQYTAIHPAVEWRFQHAAADLIEKRKKDPAAEIESIVFPEVYPLYGLSDIRNSSVKRNHAIQSDLIEHMRMAHDILKAAIKIKKMDMLDELNYRIHQHITQIESGLKSGDEVAVIDFLRYEIESVFGHLAKLNPGLDEMIVNYGKLLDPELKTFYARRKEYENSVATINSEIAAHLEEAQKEAQNIYPHYFEKYKTDGVEHGIYIGASMSKQPFDLLYLRNLRLWQLKVMAEIARKTDQLKTKLKVPLDATHLILVQDTPLAIRFRMDEKKFDVDGTYNLRYEIMKKRIDKAIIKGKSERLTQPGKIAIVYSQPKEAEEYQRYIEYLTARKYLNGNIEKLDLQELQGVSGLRALRVDVQLELEPISEPIEDVNLESLTKILTD